jgi:uncharacterized peroxidase-related enzyme
MPSADRPSRSASPVIERIPIVEPEEASPEVQAVYADFQRRMACPAAPNFIKAQGHSLAVASGTWGLVSNVLVDGTLPRTIKEMLFVAISHDRNCRYCEAAHIACCRMLGVDTQTIETVMQQLDKVEPKTTRAILSFGLKCARSPQSLETEDFDSLKQVGLTATEIVEVLSMSALAVYANILADATGIADDEMFQTL